MNTFKSFIEKKNNTNINNIAKNTIEVLLKEVKDEFPNTEDEQILNMIVDYLIEKLDLQEFIIESLENIERKELSNTNTNNIDIFKSFINILNESIPNNELLLNQTYLEIINEGIATYINQQLQKREEASIIIPKETIDDAVNLVTEAKQAAPLYYIANLKYARTDKITKSILKIGDFIWISMFFDEYALNHNHFKKLNKDSVKRIVNKVKKSNNGYIIYEILKFFLLEFDYSNPINKRISNATNYMEELFEALLNTLDAHSIYYIYDNSKWYYGTDSRKKIMTAIALSKDMEIINELFEKYGDNYEFQYFIQGVINTKDKDFIAEILKLPNLKEEYKKELEYSINDLDIKEPIDNSNKNNLIQDVIKNKIDNILIALQQKLINDKDTVNIKQTIIHNLLNELSNKNPNLFNNIEIINEYINTISLLEKTLIFIEGLPKLDNNNTNNFNEIISLGTKQYINQLLSEIQHPRDKHIPTLKNFTKLVNNIKDKVTFLNKVADMAIKLKDINLIAILSEYCYMGGEEFTNNLVDTVIDSNDASCIFFFLIEHGVSRAQKVRLAYAMAKTNNAKRIYDVIHHIYWKRDSNHYEKIIEKRYELFDKEQYKNYKELYNTLAVALINTNDAEYISELIKLIIRASRENYNNLEGGHELLPSLIDALIKTENHKLIDEIYNNGNKSIMPYKDTLAKALEELKTKSNYSFEHKEAGPREIVKTGPIRKKIQ